MKLWANKPHTFQMSGWEIDTMRSLALMAIVLGCGGAASAGAQTVSGQTSASVLAEAAFAPKTSFKDADPIGAVLDRESFTARGDPVRWSSGEMQLSRPSAAGPVDSLRFSVGGDLHSPSGLPIDPARAQFEAQAYEVSVIRNWPAALSFDTPAFDVDLSPHAGVGITSYGGSAEAGATLRLSQRVGDRAVAGLKSMGVREGATLGGQGRWYLFAAASGRAVGLNMLRGETGWDRGGWTTDPTSTLIGDAQVGVGWRKGPIQTSLGYLHREIKGQHMLWGQDTREDSVVALSLSIKPQR
jgi:hypothetical protein